MMKICNFGVFKKNRATSIVHCAVHRDRGNEITRYVNHYLFSKLF